MRNRSFLLATIFFAVWFVPTGAANAQPAATLSANAASPAAMQQQLDEARQLLREQAGAIERLRLQLEGQGREIEVLRRRLPAPERLTTASADDAARLQTAVLNLASPVLRPALAQSAKPTAKPDAEPPAPLLVRIGSATFTPSGYVDFTAFYRTTNLGSGIGATFASVPYSNTVQGGLSELRFSAQSTRIAMKVDEKIGPIKAMAYVETDFNGNQAGNLYVNKNSNTLRMRIAYANLAASKWELLGGQYWSLLTPTRRTLSPNTADLFTTNHVDSNYQVGLVYARQPGIRFVYHPSRAVALGLALENSEQYTGSAVVFPTLFANTEVDLNSSSGSGGANATPNAMPDVIAKLTFDHKISGLDWHLGLGGLLTTLRIVTPASVTKAVVAKDTRAGGGTIVNFYGQLHKSFNLIGQAFWSDGGGRYLNGDGPAFVVLQNGAATAPFRAALIHSGSALAGFEWKASKRMTLSGTASGESFQRRFTLDPSKTATYAGYGFTGSANSNNRSLAEYSLATNNTLWQSTTAGSLVLVTQGSYITRSPWYVAAGAPKNAHLYMQYVALRYVIP